MTALNKHDLDYANRLIRVPAARIAVLFINNINFQLFSLLSEKTISLLLEAVYDYMNKCGFPST